MLAVLLDGPGWAARRTVGDRDGLPVEVLSKLMHWPAVQRVWLPEWLVDRDACWTDCRASCRRRAVAAVGTSGGSGASGRGRRRSGRSSTAGLRQLQSSHSPVDAESTGTGRPSHPSGPATVLQPRRVDRSAARPAARPNRRRFTAKPPSPLGFPARWASGTCSTGCRRRNPQQRVYAAMISAIEAEGPIQLDRLVRLVAAGFGLHRVVAARHAAILAVLPAGLNTDPVAPEFVWPPSLDPLTWQGFRRTPDGVERSLEQISPRESAMRWSRSAAPPPG